VSFRDIQPIWDVASQILFYVSPVIISVETVAEKVSTTLLHLYMLNPLAVVFQQFRHAMITHGTPSAKHVIGGSLELLAPLAIVVGVFVLGFWVFNRSAPLVAENL
jgi:ABC-2 type transport system permease protein